MVETHFRTNPTEASPQFPGMQCKHCSCVFILPGSDLVRPRKTPVLQFLFLSRREGQSVAQLAIINPAINGASAGLSALQIFSLSPAREDSIQHTYSLTMLGEPSKTLHLQSLQRSASISCSSCPALLFINSSGKKIIGRENQVFPILHDEGPTREITCPTVPAKKIPGINISPC